MAVPEKGVGRRECPSRPSQGVLKTSANLWKSFPKLGINLWKTGALRRAHPAHDVAQEACSDVELGMTMNRPTFNLSDAARLTGVSRSTMRRYREAGDFPNAYKNTDRQWMIPVEDLLARGLKLQGELSRAITLTEPAQALPQAGAVDMPTGMAKELNDLRRELAVEQARRQGVEELLVEVRRRADLAEMALKQLEAPKTQEPIPAPAAEAPATEELKRRWWQW